MELPQNLHAYLAETAPYILGTLQGRLSASQQAALLRLTGSPQRAKYGGFALHAFLLQETAHHPPALVGGHWVTTYRSGIAAHLYVADGKHTVPRGTILAGPRALIGVNVHHLGENLVARSVAPPASGAQPNFTVHAAARGTSAVPSLVARDHAGTALDHAISDMVGNPLFDNAAGTPPSHTQRIRRAIYQALSSFTQNGPVHRLRGVDLPKSRGVPFGSHVLLAAQARLSPQREADHAASSYPAHFAQTLHGFLAELPSHALAEAMQDWLLHDTGSTPQAKDAFHASDVGLPLRLYTPFVEAAAFAPGGYLGCMLQWAATDLLPDAHKWEVLLASPALGQRAYRDYARHRGVYQAIFAAFYLTNQTAMHGRGQTYVTLFRGVRGRGEMAAFVRKADPTFEVGPNEMTISPLSVWTADRARAVAAAGAHGAVLMTTLPRTHVLLSFLLSEALVPDSLYVLVGHDLYARGATAASIATMGNRGLDLFIEKEPYVLTHGAPFSYESLLRPL